MTRWTAWLAVLTLVALSAPLPAQKANDDDNGEVRLYVRATFTGKHTFEGRYQGAGPKGSRTRVSETEQLAVTFAGTTTYRITNWAPTEMSHNCAVTSEGGGRYIEVETGTQPCDKHAGDPPFTETRTESWTFEVPSKPALQDPLLSPAGMAVVIPVGMWSLTLSAIPNAYEIKPRGQWQRSLKWCCPKTERGTLEGGGAMSSVRAHYLVRDAWQGSLGADAPPEVKLIRGTWDTAKKGFFASGRILKKSDSRPKTANDGSSTESASWQADIFWSVSYNLTPPPVECIIENNADDGKWLPEGGGNEATAGNHRDVLAHLQVKGKPGSTPTQKGQFRFELLDCSQEPGVALNKPLANAQTTPDLRFVASTGMTPGDDGKTCQSAKGVQSALARLDCYDYGAYGKVRVTCTLDDGSVVYGHLEGQAGKEELSIPTDENGNHIADSWEEQEGVSGKPADWDEEDTPRLDTCYGDGLSLYQEYRGLVGRDGIVRLKGKQIDLVVENRAGDGMRAGLKLFEQGSGIHVVELGEGALPEDRWVNKNHGTGDSGVVQHGLRLVQEALPAGTIGMAWPDAVKRSPGDCDRVALNTDLSFMAATDRQSLLPAAVAHELGHALGAQHHGDSGGGTTRENLTLSDSRSNEVVGADGAVIAQRPYVLKGAAEEKASGGESSGVWECFMRNTSFFQWVCHVDNMGVAHYYAVPPAPAGTTLCTSTQATGPRAPDGKPYFGDAAAGRGECLHRLRVTDRY